MKVITNDELRKIQVNLLTAFAEYCDKNHLKYMLCAGTLLGAIRHKGFIPWDDDVDVMMPRPDYQKFIELSKNSKINENTNVLDYTLNNSIYPYVKLTDNRTLVKERFTQKGKMGVWIDVFPIDGNFKNNFLNAMQYRTANILRKIIGAQSAGFGKGTTAAKRIEKIIFYPLLKIIPHKFLCNLINKLSAIKDFNSSMFAGLVIWGYGKKERMPKEVFINTTEVEFEGCKFKAPSNYDNILSNIYGDYMTPPPKEKQSRHDFQAWWKTEV